MTPPIRVAPLRRRLAIGVALSVIVPIRAGAKSMKTDLSAEERRLLGDIKSFNASHGKGWKLSGRSVRNLSWTGLQLSASALQDVDLHLVNLTSSQFADTAFVDVDFRGSDLSDAVFERCRIERCKFDAVQLRRTRFKDCSVVDSSAAQVSATGAVFDSVRFQQYKDSRRLYKDARFMRCGFTEAAFELSSFTHCQFDEVAFVGGRLDNLRFSDMDAKRLHFRQVALTQVACDGGVTVDPVIERCELRQFAFKGMRLSGLQLTRSRVAEGLSVAVCEVDGAVLLDNPLFEASFYRSRLGKLRIEGGRLATFAMEACQLGPGSSFKGVTFQGANFGDSRLDGTLFDACAFEKYVVLNGTTLRGVRLPQARFARGLEIDAAGVVYDGGERFPTT